MVQFGFLFFLKTIMKKINISNNFLNKLVLFERFYFTILDFTLFNDIDIENIKFEHVETRGWNACSFLAI